MDKELEAGVTVGGFGFVGIIFAMIAQQLYTQGTLVDEFIKGTVSIADLMAILIIFWIIVGVFIAVLRY